MKKVLIVDDSQAEIRLMQQFLEQAGYWVVPLGDATRLESMAEMERPSLILLDVVMPQRNGFQACRELKSHPELGSIPVVLVTSKSSDSDKFWGKQQGADGYVVKPFTRDDLVKTVQGLIG